MRRHERGYVSVPTAKQNCGASVIGLRQTKSAVFLRNFDSKRADLRESFKIFRRNFAGAIHHVRIDMFAQITFQLVEEIFARGAVLCTLRGIGVSPIEIVTPDEEIAGETSTILERIARGLSQLERLALAFGHLRCIDDGGRRGLFHFRAGFLSDLFLRRFERRFHEWSASMLLALAGMLPA